MATQNICSFLPNPMRISILSNYDKLKHAFDRYDINNTIEYKYLNGSSPEEFLFARKQFELLIGLLFENKPHIYLEMSLDSLLNVTKNPKIYFRSCDREVVKDIYWSYVLKYSKLLRKFLQTNPLSRSPKDFLIDCFINDHIYNFCKNGIYKCNLLSLEYTVIQWESETYFREKLYNANNMFSGKSVIDNSSSWQADYNDKLFDVSFLSIRDIPGLLHLTRYRIDEITKLFRSTLRADKFN